LYIQTLFCANRFGALVPLAECATAKYDKRILWAGALFATRLFCPLNELRVYRAKNLRDNGRFVYLRSNPWSDPGWEDEFMLLMIDNYD